MLIHNDKFFWQGWGGKLKLGSGGCWLRIFDLRKADQADGLTYLKPIIVVVSDIAESSISVKSSASHAATQVVKQFQIDPHRMVWVEYYPERRYGTKGEKSIPKHFDFVEFVWRENLALHPRWREIDPELEQLVLRLLDMVDGADDAS